VLVSLLCVYHIAQSLRVHTSSRAGPLSWTLQELGKPLQSRRQTGLAGSSLTCRCRRWLGHVACSVFVCVLHMACSVYVCVCVLHMACSVFVCVCVLHMACSVFVCVLHMACSVFVCVLHMACSVFVCVPHMACSVFVCCTWHAVYLCAERGLECV